MEKKVCIQLSRSELYIIYTALNEICNGIEIPEFELRIGVPEKKVCLLLDKVGDLYRKIKKEDSEHLDIELTNDELYIIYTVLNEICNISEIPEFELRIGYPEEQVAQVLAKIGNKIERER